MQYRRLRFHRAGLLLSAIVVVAVAVTSATAYAPHVLQRLEAPRDGSDDCVVVGGEVG